VGEVGDFSVFVSDKGLLTCVMIGVIVVTWDVIEFSVGEDGILSLFSWLGNPLEAKNVIVSKIRINISFQYFYYFYLLLLLRFIFYLFY
jgi:hypothetical protein